MLHVVFLGMELRILDHLRSANIHLSGVYLPNASYILFNHLRPFLKFSPGFIKKKFKHASIFFPLFQYLQKNDIPALQAHNVNSAKFIKTVEILKPDLGVISNFGQILSNRLLQIPKYGYINYHPSLLPRYRGPTPLQQALLNQDRYTGVTWHYVSSGIDQGDILAQKSLLVEPQDTLKSLEEKALTQAVDLLTNLLEEIDKNLVKPVPQNEAQATYCSKPTKEEKELLRTWGKL